MLAPLWSERNPGCKDRPRAGQQFGHVAHQISLNLALIHDDPCLSGCGTPGGGRTRAGPGLSRLPLPLGYGGTSNCAPVLYF